MSQTDGVCVSYSLYNRGIFVHPQELPRRDRETQCEFERSSLQHWKDLLIRTSNTTQTQILVDVLAINVRNPFWGANSDAFDPSRLKNIKQSDVCSPQTQTLSQPLVLTQLCNGSFDTTFTRLGLAVASAWVSTLQATLSNHWWFICLMNMRSVF